MSRDGDFFSHKRTLFFAMAVLHTGAFSRVVILEGADDVLSLAIKVTHTAGNTRHANNRCELSRRIRRLVGDSMAGMEGGSEAHHREVCALRALGRHEFIVKTMLASSCRDFSYITMEAALSDLKAVIKTHWASITLESKTIWASQIGRAIRHMHKCRFVHRDIKPNNVLVFSSTLVKLSDFGLSEYAEAAELKCPGSLEYAAPELLAGGDYDLYAVDEWAFGVSLFELHTGGLPFHQGAVAWDERFYTHMCGESPWAVDGAMSAVIGGLLVIRPSFRLRVNAAVRRLDAARRALVIDEDQVQFG